MSVIQLNGSNFSQVTTSVTPWLVSFSADWCGPCKALKPEFQEAAAQLEGVVKLGYLHADRENSLAAKYGVKGFPTVIFFNAGSVEVYTGQRKAKSIVQYARVKTGAVGVPAPGEKKLLLRRVGKEKWLKVQFNVSLLTEDNEESEEEDSDGEKSEEEDSDGEESKEEESEEP